jgi:4-amino-4-deoxy-L-arabinose transferase-like glycosyltransferase
MTPQKKTSISVILLMLTGALFFLPFLGSFPLMDWDEANFAEIAREMIETGDYLNMHINYIAFTEKPPLFFWLQVISMKIFGINEFAARFPNAFTGIITLPVLYLIGKRLFNRFFGLIWALAYLGSILPHFYFKSGIIDPVFNFFIFLSIYFLFRYFIQKRENTLGHEMSKWLLLLIAGLFCGLAILTKGPVALLIIGLLGLIVFIRHRFRYFSITDFLYYLFIVFGVVMIWLGIATIKYGTLFISDFIQRQYELFSTPDAGHAGFPGYHFAILLLGCFPVSVFALKTLFKTKQKETFQTEWHFWMIALFWIVLILFTIVRSKIVHYSSMAYFPVTFLGAMAIMKIIKNEMKFNKCIWIVLGAISAIATLSVLLIYYFGTRPEALYEVFKNDTQVLQAISGIQVNWSILTILPAIVSLLSFIVFFILGRKNRNKPAFQFLLLSNAVWVAIAIILILPKILIYSQGVTTSFYKSKANENCYVSTYRFKSYIPYFYVKQNKGDVFTIQYLNFLEKEKNVLNIADLNQIEHNAFFNEFLLRGNIEKPAYIVTRTQFMHDIETRFPELVKLKSEGGYGFYVRIPKN